MSNLETDGEKNSSPQLHPKLCKGDVAFTSSDGIMFRLKRETLLECNASVVFQEMLELPEPSGNEVEPDAQCNKQGMDNKAIDMKVDSKVLEGFLGLLITPIPMMPSQSFEDVCSILKLCHKYDVRVEYMDMVRQRISEAASPGPHRFWITLKLASRLDDRSLGKMILSQFNAESLHESYEPHFSKLSFSWQGKINSLCLEHSTEIEVKQGQGRFADSYKYFARPIRRGKWVTLFDNFASDKW
ncbi:uncharacterized protein IL334_000647 [Kwoniella shivajii]|uniref:BTB domain-containing protein n=1 Tax=Kwoniella shivajii TaxID=564305 RepID=A0ABZ1CR80_9TREE|nr:hypothetical protein IL334_000647 [Kwoniella shivajii]